MKANISELIYNQETQSDHNNWEHRMPYKEMFQNKDIDFTIQLENLITFHQCWEKYPQQYNMVSTRFSKR